LVVFLLCFYGLSFNKSRHKVVLALRHKAIIQ